MPQGVEIPFSQCLLHIFRWGEAVEFPLLNACCTYSGGARSIVATSVPVLDGLSATTMDEALLRGEPLLFWYWTSVAWLSYKQCQSEIAARKSTLQARLRSQSCTVFDSLTSLSTQILGLASVSKAHAACFVAYQAYQAFQASMSDDHTPDCKASNITNVAGSTVVVIEHCKARAGGCWEQPAGEWQHFQSAGAQHVLHGHLQHCARECIHDGHTPSCRRSDKRWVTRQLLFRAANSKLLCRISHALCHLIWCKVSRVLQSHASTNSC